MRSPLDNRRSPLVPDYTGAQTPAPLWSAKSPLPVAARAQAPLPIAVRQRMERLAGIYEARAIGHMKKRPPKPDLAAYDRQVAADIRALLSHHP